MSIRWGWRLCLCLAVAPAVASGQVVQLPTFHSFSVNTTVSVPDGGAAYLGGVNRARWGAASRGAPGLSKLPVAGRLFGSRGVASDCSSSAAHVTATIIDLEEWDRAVLAAGAARRGQNADDVLAARKAAFISQHVARRDPEPTPSTRPAAAARPALSGDRNSVHSMAADQREAEAISLFAKGRAAEAAGNRGAAKVYYHMASRRASGDLKEQVTARIDAIQNGETPRLAAHETP